MTSETKETVTVTLDREKSSLAVETLEGFALDAMSPSRRKAIIDTAALLDMALDQETKEPQQTTEITQEMVDAAQNAFVDCGQNVPDDEVMRAALEAAVRRPFECDCDPDMKIADDCKKLGCREARANGATQPKPTEREDIR